MDAPHMAWYIYGIADTSAPWRMSTRRPYPMTTLIMPPTQLFKCLSDETRLALMLLIHTEGELCVCEMTHALEESQPKISRHLAQLRACEFLQDRRQGQWVYYRLMPSLPDWALAALDVAAEGASSRLASLRKRLESMGNRPTRQAACC